MKVRFFDIIIIFMMLVAAGVKTDTVTGSEQPARVWTLEEASFLGNNAVSHSADRNIVQAVTRQNEGVECIFKCGIHQDD
jgi:hypothetical protein